MSDLMVNYLVMIYSYFDVSFLRGWFCYFVIFIEEGSEKIFLIFFDVYFLL